ncbi:MAG: restriction endonuclease subunit S [Magnetococcales bacterium]|nr:restriction endonuclease subunit S [Magnetococcales bacterium]NGZ25413.1 restriction endonuclease subunit S [Magnetococcales bacterium]
MAIWRECLLGDVLNLKRGYDLPHNVRSPGIIPVVSSSGITDHHSEAKVKGPGVVTGRYGTLGQVFYVDSDFWPLNTSLYVQDFKGNDPRFISYFLGTLNFGSHNAAGAVPGVNRNHLHAMEVRLPPLPIQRRVAGILSAYDELIENNQQRIKILETMARALYREWFVHFRFPGHENVRRVPSPLGEIPEGWEVKKLGELYDTSSGGTPSRKKPEYFEGGSIDWVKSQELLDGFILSSEERITEKALDNSSAKVFPENTVLIALYGATIGKLGIIAEKAATNQACCAVLPKRSAFGREFAFLTLLLNRERIIGLRLGAAQQNISQVLLRNLDCVKPPDKLVSQFTGRSASFMDGILILQRQTQNLRRTRDLLLPRLLSGQIDVEAIPHA